MDFRLKVFIFFILSILLTGCVSDGLDFDFFGENVSNEGGEDSIKYFDVSVSAEEFREDYLRQMFYLPGGGGECEPYEVEVKVDGDLLHIMNLPNKTITLVVYRIVEGSDCGGQETYQFHSDYHFLPDEFGAATIRTSLLPQDEFIIVSSGETLWKPHCMFTDLWEDYCDY
jgi:hypothetical protein